MQELKAACKEHGLEQGGNKAELAARLKAALSQQQANGDAAAKAAEPVVQAAEASKPTEQVPVADPQGPKSAQVPAAAGGNAATENGAGKARAKIMFSDSEATVSALTPTGVCCAERLVLPPRVYCHISGLREYALRWSECLTPVTSC